MQKVHFLSCLLRPISLFTSLLLFSSLAHGVPQPVAATPGVVIWYPGTNLRLYIAPDTKNTPKCAPDLASANNDANLVPIWSNDGKIVAKKPAAPGPKISLSFRLVNGWLTDDARFDESGQTLIKASEPSATGGECLFSGPDKVVGQRPCGPDHQFQFYIETKASDGGMYRLSDPNMYPIKVDWTGDLIGSDITYDPNICVYDAATGSTVVPPSNNAHIPAAELTSLVGKKLPPNTEPTDEELLPGCDEGTTSKIDCLISRAYNSLPQICETKPHNRECVLHLIPAFCGDVPGRRFEQYSSGEVENCIRSVALGPCVANPGGAACAAGVFAGIVQFASGGGQIGKRLARRSQEHSLERRDFDPLFGEPENNLPLLDQFWVGVLESLINSAINIVELLRNGMVYSARQSCYSMTFQLGQSLEEVNKVRESCAEFFHSQDPLPTIPYQGEIEAAGGTFADIIQMLFAVNDLANAISASKWVGKVRSVLKYFKPKASGAGQILEAEGPGGVVQLFNEYGEGKPVPFYTDGAIEDLKMTTEQNAFSNCATCGGGIVKRQGGAVTKLFCCRPMPNRELEFQGDPDSELEVEMAGEFRRHVIMDEAIPMARRVIDNTYLATHDPAALAVFQDGTRTFNSYYFAQKPEPPNISRAMKVFYDELQKQYRAMAVNPAQTRGYRQVMKNASQRMWGLSPIEARAIDIWVARGLRNHVDLESALRKMNPVKTWTIAQQEPPADVINMLLKVQPGLTSKGPRGIYTLRDIKRSSTVAAIRPSNPEPIAFSTSLGMFPAYRAATLPVRYVILSATGRYIAPVSGSAYHEVLFYEGLCGKFQLLGFQELNGGQAAWRAGDPPPFYIFHFREIDSPPFTELPEPPNLPIINYGNYPPPSTIVSTP